MDIEEIENYLSIKNTQLNNSIGEAIEEHRNRFILAKDEAQANYCWCLRQIYRIQKKYISAINALKNKKFEDSWCMLEQIEIELSSLEENFDIKVENDKYHMVFISQMISEYQKLFPYCHFFSRECIIKAEKCTICGAPISLRQPCGHRVGKLYMGELCLREVTDMEFKAECIVTDPFDKYAYIQIPDKEYNYGMLENLMMEIDDPYEEFHIETIKVLKPEYKNIGRNQLCPCGSGKKYKKCHWKTNDELMNHHKVHLSKPLSNRENRFVGIFGTWK